MPRKSLRPHLNQIRAWVRQGRTDAWVAHQLEVTVRDIEQFKRQNELVSDEAAPLTPAELEAAEEEAELARAKAEEADGDEPTEDGEQASGTRTRKRSRR